jgi:hypothetical protein
MPYKVISTANRLPLLPEHHNPPYSIPGVHLPHWEIHDNIVDATLHKKVYDYLLQCDWHQPMYGVHSELQLFKPGEWDESWAAATVIRRTIGQPRVMFGSDEDSTRKRHPIIAELWDTINAQLGNAYAITGADEGMAWKDYPCPTPTDPNLPTGWRVYANGTRHDLLSLQGYVHRDNFDFKDETSVTMLWTASMEWYPSWGGELILYPEDPNGLTGDHQQFNQGPGQQRRNFQIGWQDEGKMICMRPGRLIIYDGRTLHSSQPSRHRHNTIMHMRVAFRARKIK